MGIPFAIIGALTVGSGVAVMTLRNLVHCALALTVTLAGLAVLYLQLDAQFVGFAQILIYIGAVAILIVFAILLTRSGDASGQPLVSASWLASLLVAVLVFGVLANAIFSSTASRRELPPPPDVAVHRIGEQLMTNYVLPLEVVGLLLTAAAIGAVIIAMR